MLLRAPPPLLLLAAAVLLSALALAAADHSHTTPADGAPNQDPSCQLQSLTFSNGLTIPNFQPDVFHYTCVCPPWQSGYSVVAYPYLKDPFSSAEVWINGVEKNSKAGLNAISNGGAVLPHSPETQSAELPFHDGENVIVIGVSCNGRGQPNPCYYEYEIRCGPEGFIVGDPQFVGLRGQSYQVHGVSGEVYSIVSDADLQYNSRFVFLDAGECPVVDGKRQKGCWSHPGSYLGELGLKTRAGDRIHLLSGPAQQGYSGVLINGEELPIGETYELKENLGFVSRNTTHLAEVHVGKWEFVFENSDRFVNQRVRVSDSRSLRAHGLLGQTWRETTYPNALKYVQGEVDDYVIREKDVFGDNFVYNFHN